ncbi:putative enzyme related to lactoylglutathione lyase [Curtobacterium sp. PhB115]|nr:putative enzyme related to lactoylglutathione lyase [Curtobacterium sp. PhB115]
MRRKLVHFDIPLVDVTLAVVGYEDVFGLERRDWVAAPYWDVTDADVAELHASLAVPRGISADTLTVLIDPAGLASAVERVTRAGRHSPVRSTALLPDAGQISYLVGPLSTITGVLQR